MRGVTHDRGVSEVLDCYSILLLLFLDIVDFWSKRTDLDATSGPYASKKVIDPFSVIRLITFLLRKTSEYIVL